MFQKMQIARAIGLLLRGPGTPRFFRTSAPASANVQAVSIAPAMFSVFNPKMLVQEMVLVCQEIRASRNKSLERNRAWKARPWPLANLAKIQQQWWVVAISRCDICTFISWDRDKKASSGNQMFHKQMITNNWLTEPVWQLTTIKHHFEVFWLSIYNQVFATPAMVALMEQVNVCLYWVFVTQHTDCVACACRRHVEQ